MKQPTSIKLALLSVLILALAGASFGLKMDLQLNRGLQADDAASQLLWSQRRVEVNIGIGGSFTKSISVTSSTALRVRVSLQQSLQRIISVDPGVLSLQPNTPSTIAISFRIPNDAAPGQLEGLLGLTTVDERPIGEPVEVGVNVRNGFVDPATNIGLTLPAIGFPTQIQLSGTPENPKFDIQVLRGADGAFVTVASLHVYNNPDHLSLIDWFARNVDQGGVLAQNKTFQLISAGEGKSAMVLAGDVPDEYDGLVQFEYAMSATRDRVVAISQDQDNQLSDFGLSVEATRAFERQTIDNVQFFQ